MRVNNENLLQDSGPLDLSTNQTLEPVWLGHIAQYAVQLAFTGSPNGSFKLQASNDKGRINSATNVVQVSDLAVWTDITGSTALVTAAGDIMWDAENIGYNWVRIIWTATSGSGSLTSARVYVKGT